MEVKDTEVLLPPPSNKATRIRLFSLSNPHMRTFHLTWFAFFLAFFGWFGIAPMMALVRDDLGLTKTQIGNTIIASVAITILARLLIGWLCDRIGPRLAYSGLLVLGSIPVMCIGLAQNYETFLLFRLAIGVIGASFVITQYHTSVMFAPNVVGTANATTAGWGNMGGGVTQIVMPLVLTLVLMLGVNEAFGWRVAMVVPGVGLLLVGIAYYFLTQDSPEGNYRDLRAAGKMAPSPSVSGSFLDAAKDYRVWALFIIYGACFGVELTINNVAALYYYDRFELNLATAGLIAGMFGLMNIFAPDPGRIFRRQVRDEVRAQGSGDVHGRRTADGGPGAHPVLADGHPVPGRGRHDHFQPVRPDVRGSYLLGGALHQPQGPGLGGGYRGGGRQRRSGSGGLPVPHGKSYLRRRADAHRHSGGGRRAPGLPGAVLPTAGNGGKKPDAGSAGQPESPGGRGRPRSGRLGVQQVYIDHY